MIKKILSKVGMLLCLILGISACAQSDPQLKSVVLNGATLVDVRSPFEFADGTVEGAINIPLDRLQSRLDELKKKEHIVVFCRSGNRSGKALKILNENGFQNVLNGGTWKAVQAIKENHEN